MDLPLISVIVPVYNVKKYLNRCLDSILGQTYPCLEIVLIDDGSTDGSSELCDSFSAKFKNVHVIHKENAGLGMARNTGIDNCNGEYILFVDSDDFIDLEMIQTLYNALYNGTSVIEAEAAMCGFYVYSNESESVIKRNSAQRGIYSGKEVILSMLGSEPDSPIDVEREMSVWLNLYSMKRINSKKLRFISERKIISEDIAFNIAYFSDINKVVSIEKPLYYYGVNSQSLSRSYKSNRFEKECELFLYVINELKQYDLNDEDYQIRWKRTFLGRSRVCICAEVNKSGKTIVDSYIAVKKICNNELLRNVVEHYPVEKGPIKQKFFNVCIQKKLYILIYFMALLNNLK